MNAYFLPLMLTFVSEAMHDDGSYPPSFWEQPFTLLTEEEWAPYWKQNPPQDKVLGAVDGYPAWVGYVPPEIPLSEAAESKRYELREACSGEITRSSFQSNALGQVHNYDCRIVDQLNLKVRYDIATSTGTDEPLWASDGTRYQWKNHSSEEIMEVMIDMNTHVKVAQVKLATKLAAVDAATTSAQISAIYW